MLRSWQGLFAITALAFLAFLERAFLDWRYVFAEFVPDDDIAGAVALLAVYVAFSGAWLWALAGVANRRRAGAIAVLALSAVLLVAGGVSTTFVLCPSPCPTAWPLVEISNWAGLAAGLLTVTVAGRRLSAVA